MNKTQLIDAVAGKTGLSKTQTAKMLDALLATLEESLANRCNWSASAVSA